MICTTIRTTGRRSPLTAHSQGDPTARHASFPNANTDLMPDANPNATVQAVADLDTVDDDATVQRLRSSLSDLQADLKDVQSDLNTARSEADDAADELEELEIEQYASEEVTEADVQGAEQRLASEQDEVDRLERKAANLQEAISRVSTRIRSEVEGDAAARLYDDYKDVVQATTERAQDAVQEAMRAVEAMNAAHRKAEQQGVKTDADATRRAFGVPVDRLMGLKSPRVGVALDKLSDEITARLDYIDRNEA